MMDCQAPSNAAIKVPTASGANTPGWPVLVDPTAVSGLAVRAPLALRLVQCRDAQDLATECAASACAPRNRFIRGHRRRFRRQCGNVAATGDRVWPTAMPPLHRRAA